MTCRFLAWVSVWVSAVFNENREYKRREVVCSDVVAVLVQGKILHSISIALGLRFLWDAL